MKMPHARANAVEASLPTLVELGRECLRIRRTQANGGSNSMADGGDFVVEDVLLLLADVLVVVADDGSAGLGAMVVMMRSMVSKNAWQMNKRSNATLCYSKQCQG